MAEHHRMPDESFQRAVVGAVESMHQEPSAGERLHKAADLVLTGRVTIDDDGTATVQSGSHTYQIDPEDGCPCEDARRRSKWCKHAVAVEVLKRARARMDEPGNGTEPTPPGDAPRSAAWQVQEAPASCCLKFQMGLVECLYTMRDCDDDLLFARVRRILPKLLEKTNGSGGGAQPETPRCAIHNVPMKRYSKGDTSWVSHKAPDGSWCRGT